MGLSSRVAANDLDAEKKQHEKKASNFAPLSILSRVVGRLLPSAEDAADDDDDDDGGDQPRPLARRSLYLLQRRACRQVTPEDADDDDDDDDAAAAQGAHLAESAGAISVMDSRWLIIRRMSNPEDPWRDRWDKLMLVIITMECLLTPFLGAFNKHLSTSEKRRSGHRRWDAPVSAHEDRAYLKGLIVSYCFDLFTVVDMVLQTVTLVYDFRLGIVDDFHELKMRYLRSPHFVADVVAIFPLEVIGYYCAGFGWHTRTFSVLRLFRVFRVNRVVSTLSRWGSSIRLNAAVFGIAECLFGVLFASHWVACSWFWIGYARADKRDNAQIELEGLKEPKTWLDLVPGWQTYEVSLLYVKSLYWTMSTMTTVGYGDLIPVSTDEHIYAMFVMLFGHILFAYIFGLMATFISSLDVTMQNFRVKVDSMQRFLKYRNVSPEICERINRYHDNTWAQTRGFDEFVIMKDLPISIHLDLALHLYREMIVKVPIFQNSDPSFLSSVVLLLVPKVFPGNEFIIRKGEVAREMFFLQRGTCEIVYEVTGARIAQISDGQYFGEVALLCDARRSATIRSVTEVDLLVLHRSDLEKICADHPKVASKMKALALKRRTLIAEHVIKLLLFKNTQDKKKKSKKKTPVVVVGNRRRRGSVQDTTTTTFNGDDDGDDGDDDDGKVLRAQALEVMHGMTPEQRAALSEINRRLTVVRHTRTSDDGHYHEEVKHCVVQLMRAAHRKRVVLKKKEEADEETRFAANRKAEEEEEKKKRKSSSLSFSSSSSSINDNSASSKSLRNSDNAISSSSTKLLYRLVPSRKSFGSVGGKAQAMITKGRSSFTSLASSRPFRQKGAAEEGLLLTDERRRDLSSSNDPDKGEKTEERPASFHIDSSLAALSASSFSRSSLSSVSSMESIDAEEPIIRPLAQK